MPVFTDRKRDQIPAIRWARLSAMSLTSPSTMAALH
jgi:hypothetical protein